MYDWIVNNGYNPIIILGPKLDKLKRSRGTEEIVEAIKERTEAAPGQ